MDGEITELDFVEMAAESVKIELENAFQYFTDPMNQCGS